MFRTPKNLCFECSEHLKIQIWLCSEHLKKQTWWCSEHLKELFIPIAWQSGLFQQAQLTWKGVKVNRLPYSLRSNGFRGANY